MLVNFFALQGDISTSFDDFDKYIEQQRVQRKVPGVAVVIVHDDKIVFAKGYGVSKVDSEDKIDPDTIFQLASISKAFTAAGLGIQVDQKKLGWDDRIVKYLPGFELKDSYPTYYTTTRDLLAHRTGLPAFGGDLISKLGYTADEVLSRIKYIEPASSFRESSHYSNVGYFSAGQVLASVAGMSLEQAVQKTLLTPLKMTRTGYWEGLDKSNVAHGHAVVDGKLQEVPYDKSILFAAAGGVTSTANDLGKWMIMHLNGGAFEGNQILKPETIKAMHAPSMVGEISFAELPPIDENSSYTFGMGWDNYQYHGKYIVEKAGALDGVRTVMTIIPEAKIGIVILANMNLTVLPEEIRAKFLTRNFGDPQQDLAKEFNEHEQQLSKLLEAPPKPKEVLPIGHTLDKYTGEFENQFYGKIHVIQTDKQLVVEAGPGRFPGKLVHWSNDTFLLKWDAVNTANDETTFVFGPEGAAVELQTESYGNFRKIAPVKKD